MEIKLNKNRTGLIMGGAYALWHFVWSVLVLVGWADAFVDFESFTHFLINPTYVNDFSFNIATLLVLITFAIGYIFGWLFAWLWNTLHPFIIPHAREFELED